jgi:hypothetical protein
VREMAASPSPRRQGSLLSASGIVFSSGLPFYSLAWNTSYTG